MRGRSVVDIKVIFSFLPYPVVTLWIALTLWLATTRITPAIRARFSIIFGRIAGTGKSFKILIGYSPEIRRVSPNNLKWNQKFVKLCGEVEECPSSRNTPDAHFLQKFCHREQAREEAVVSQFLFVHYRTGESTTVPMVGQSDVS